MKVPAFEDVFSSSPPETFRNNSKSDKKNFLHLQPQQYAQEHQSSALSPE
jgi:hypothetical protein